MAQNRQPLPEGNDCRIAVYKADDVDLSQRDHWPSHFGWLQERCEAFVEVLRPRVKALELGTNYSSPPLDGGDSDETILDLGS